MGYDLSNDDESRFSKRKTGRKNPKGLFAPEQATEYLEGAVLLGAAPCTAMVFVWSTLTNGNPAYTVVQVATNDLIRERKYWRC